MTIMSVIAKIEIQINIVYSNAMKEYKGNLNINEKLIFGEIRYLILFCSPILIL